MDASCSAWPVAASGTINVEYDFFGHLNASTKTSRIVLPVSFGRITTRDWYIDNGPVENLRHVPMRLVSTSMGMTVVPLRPQYDVHVNAAANLVQASKVAPSAMSREVNRRPEPYSIAGPFTMR